MAESSLYLYGIVDADDPTPDVSTWSGLKDAPLRTIAREEVAVVVSDVPTGRLRPRRKNLRVHHDTLRRLADTTAVLPMAFGVIAEQPDDVVAFLESHHDTLFEQLDTVRGHVEVTLRVRWDVDDIFEYFVSRYDDLREMRNALFSNGSSADRGEMIRLGELFDRLLQAERQAHLSTVLDTLDRVCRRVEPQDPKDESEVLNLACLVPRTGVEAFEEAVHHAAESFDDEFLFKYTDPMAPYSFAQVGFEE